MEIAPEAIQGLAEYNFPSNIIELKNIVERACVLAPEAMIKPSDLPLDLSAMNDVQDGSSSYILSDAVARTEKNLVLKALAKTEGKRAKAAELLGISRKDLWEIMKQFEIPL